MDNKKEKLQNIGIGLDDFEKLRLTNRIYVDKTELIEKMAELSNSFYFLSRPRGFGKSILCSTIKSLFEGKRHLFKNLWIDDHWNWDRIHPVIHLDMEACVADSLEEMNDKMLLMMNNLFKQFDLETDPLATYPSNQFRNLINQLYKKTGKKPVILVEGHDKPIQPHIGEPIEVTQPKGNRGFLIEAIRDKLANFYVVLKQEGAKIEFLILTGVLNISTTNVFSGLNNLNNITYGSRYATLCGYTHQELLDHYGPHLKRLAKQNNLSEQQCVDEIKRWYGGYKFYDQAETLFNPFSIVNLFKDGVFTNHWGANTPTMIINYLKTNSFQFQSIINPMISSLFMNSFDLIRPDHEGFMLQTGYLTIKEEIDDQRIRLKIPNEEVKRTFPLIVVQQLLQENKPQSLLSHFASIGQRLKKNLETGNISAFLTTLEQLISHIPLELLNKTTYKDEHVVEYYLKEDYFYTILYCLCIDADINIRAEQIILRGIIDIVITTDNYFYLFEFRINRDPAVALAQIQDRSYYKPFLVDPSRELVIIGVGLDRETKKVTSSFRTLREKGSTTPSDGPLINYKPIDC